MLKDLVLTKHRRAGRLLPALTVAVVALALTFPAVAQSAKIGVFDAQRISEETEEGKRVQENLATFRNTKQAELTAKESELADLQNQLNSQALSLSADKRGALEKDIQRKVLELNQAQETATREMQLEIAEAQNRFQEQLIGVVQQLGRSEGFTLILESSLVAYADGSADVTTAIASKARSPSDTALNSATRSAHMVSE